MVAELLRAAHIKERNGLDMFDKVKEIVAKYSQKRTHTVNTTNSFGYGFQEGEMEKEVTVGGATVFVLNVDSMEKF